MSDKLDYTVEERQQFLLSMLANVNSGLIPEKESKEDNIKTLIQCTDSIEKLLKNEKIKEVVGEWELVWGPCIAYSEMDVPQEKDSDFYTLLEEIDAEKSKNPEMYQDFDTNQEVNLDDELGFGNILSLANLFDDNQRATLLDGLNEATSEDENGRKKHLVTDNTMYVIKRINKSGEKGSKYFIGIAGTNSVSPFGWFKEDFDVETMEEWGGSLKNFGEELSEDGGNISKASWQGLQQLWNMGQKEPHLTPADKAVGRGYGMNKNAKKESLWSFIKGLENGSEIAISGHSLGGALAPVLATALADQITKKGKKHSITVMSTAAPTPGDQQFINHVHAKIDHYHAIYNAIDVVPQAWIDSDLKRASAFYPSTYGFWEFPLSDKNKLVERFMDWASDRAGGKYVRTASNNVPQHDFRITTWNEGKLEFNRNLRWKLRGLLFVMNSNMEKNPYRIFLTKIRKNVTDQEIKEFCAFLIYLGLQHVLAYTRGKGFAVGSAVIEMNEVINKFKGDNGFSKKEAGILALEHILKPLLKTVAEWATEHPEIMAKK